MVLAPTIDENTLALAMPAGGLVTSRNLANYRTNWARTVHFNSSDIRFPGSVEELQEIVSKAPLVKALGSGHCFSKIADTDGVHIVMQDLSSIEIDLSRDAAVVGGGVRYGDLAPRLHRAGRALHNLASLHDISIPGAIQTGTHGSGNLNGNLATAVREIELVTASGERLRLRRGENPGRFEGAVIGLGALGIVTSMTLDLVEAFDVRQYVYEHLDGDTAATQFDAIMGSGYSVSLFTDWLDERFTQAWVKHKVEGGATLSVSDSFYGATPAKVKRHPILTAPADACTEQLGVPGPWFDRLTHFRFGHVPSVRDEIQSEVFVARQHAPKVFERLFRLGEKIAPLLHASEVRTVAPDSLWLSPCWDRSTMAIHFTWKQDPPAVLAIVGEIEEALSDLDVRPHWGKVSAMAPDVVAARYPRFAEFKRLRQEVDPEGKFLNSYVQRLLGP